MPDDTAKEDGKIYEVVLMPIGELDLFSYAESLSKEKGFADLTEQDIEKLIHLSRI